MPCISSKLHDEDRRAGNLAGSGSVERLEVLFRFAFPDTLTTTAFGGLDHDREADFPGHCQTLFRRVCATLVVYMVWDSDNPIFPNLDVRNSFARPWDARHACMLC